MTALTIEDIERAIVEATGQVPSRKTGPVDAVSLVVPMPGGPVLVVVDQRGEPFPLTTDRHQQEVVEAWGFCVHMYPSIKDFHEASEPDHVIGVMTTVDALAKALREEVIGDPLVVPVRAEEVDYIVALISADKGAGASPSIDAQELARRLGESTGPTGVRLEVGQE